MPKETYFNLDEEKQERIIRAAISEFINNGFEKGNIGEIAKSAGIAKGSMYQYFVNKRELFLYSVQWSISFIMKKYNRYIYSEDKSINIFDFFYQSSRELWPQMKEEREIVIFIQDIFLGKYSNLKDETMEYMMKVSDEIMLKFIREGKENGYIRKDIDDNILALFFTGVTIKFKEYHMNRAKLLGEELVDKDFESFDKEIKAMLELLKNGTGVK